MDPKFTRRETDAIVAAIREVYPAIVKAGVAGINNFAAGPSVRQGEPFADGTVMAVETKTRL
jgi:hypothetical protein